MDTRIIPNNLPIKVDMSSIQTIYNSFHCESPSPTAFMGCKHIDNCNACVCDLSNHDTVDAGVYNCVYQSTKHRTAYTYLVLKWMIDNPDLWRIK